MKLKELIATLEAWAPSSYQESYDNSGLIVGDKNVEVNGCIICLDSTEEVIDEAIDTGVNLVIAHHPIVFKGLKRFNGSNYVERAVIKAIKNDINIYAIHTNLDNVRSGVNAKISDLLGLQNQKVLLPKPNLLSKLVFYCPSENATSVKAAIFKAGGGKIGNYEECSFSSSGKGTFKPNSHANPARGETNKLEELEELRIEVLVNNQDVFRVTDAMKNAHPYEEVAHEIYAISNSNQDVGSGMVGDLAEPKKMIEFLNGVKKTFDAGCIKYTEFSGDIQKVAVCGGSGGFLLGAAKRSGAQVFFTSDYKYHEFFDAENEISIIDIGHYESEQFTLDLIKDFLIDKFPNFTPRLTGMNTNPVKYF